MNDFVPLTMRGSGAAPGDALSARLDPHSSLVDSFGRVHNNLTAEG